MAGLTNTTNNSMMPAPSSRNDADILLGSRTVLLTGVVASFAFIIGNSFKDLLFAVIDRCVPDDDHRLGRKIIRFVIISTIFTALIICLYRYTKPHQDTLQQANR